MHSTTGQSALSHPTRSLAAQGDAADISTWSNIPYFFFQASRKIGFLTDALNLKDPEYEQRRRSWRLRSLLRMQKPVGYQYSDYFARRMWELVPEELKRGEIISHMQFFPRVEDARKSGTVMSYYLDATMRVLWGGDHTDELPRSFCQEIIARETERYHYAKFVVAMARATARSLIDDYKVDPAKVFVVRAGANIDEAAVQQFLHGRQRPAWRSGESFSNNQPAVLGFVGNDYKRKGLLRLVAAAEILHSRGRPVLVRAIGNCPENLQKHPLVNWLGWVNKRNETQKFLEAISSFAIGCLLSISEPLGISTLECLRLGVPVLGTNVGGIPDCVPDDAGILVPGPATPGQIADAIELSLFEPQRYAQMCNRASQRAASVTWDVTAAEMQGIWTGHHSTAKLEINS